VPGAMHRPAHGGAHWSLRWPPSSLLLSASQPVIATGVAVHRIRGGGAPVAAPQAEFRLISSSFSPPLQNVLTLQLFHHHMQMC